MSRTLPYTSPRHSEVKFAVGLPDRDMMLPKAEKAARLKALKLMEMSRLTGKDVVAQAEFATRCVQGDAGVEEHVLDHAPPLHTSTAYEMRPDQPNPWVYSRNSTPTRERLEKCLGLLEGGMACTFSSGMAAIATVLLTIKFDVLWLVNVGYTGTHSFIHSQPALKDMCVTSFEELVAHR